MSSSLSRLSRAAGAVAVAGGLLLATAPGAQALNAPVVQPSGNLNNGQTIRVNLSDLKPGARYYVSVCDGDASLGRPNCNTNEGYFQQIQASGTTAQAQFRVAKSFTTQGTANHPGSTVNCRGTSGKQCYVVVTEHGGLYTSKATAVTFN